MMLRALAAKWGGLGASGSLRDGAAKPSRSSSDARANAPMPYAERASRSRRERAFIVFIVFIGRRFRRVRSADQFALAQPVAMANPTPAEWPRPSSILRRRSRGWTRGKPDLC